MTASKKVFIAVLLFIAILSNSYKGAYAQSTLCKSSIDLCLDTLTSYNEQKCKTARACVTLAYATCQARSADFSYGELSLNGKGCSGSGIPLLSAMCLFIAALFHML